MIDVLKLYTNVRVDMVSHIAEMPAPEGMVMASIDGEGSCRQFVIADVSRDGAWITASVSDTVTLAQWR